MTAIADLPTSEPKVLVAGDTWEWKRSLTAYPASSGWVLSYALRGAGNINITTTASGDEHVVEVPAATTAPYAAGAYTWASYIAKSGARYQVGSGTLEIKPNLAAVTAGTYESRSLIKQTLDAIEAVIAGRASIDQQSYTISGRTLERTPIQDLLKLRDKYRADYQAEVQAEQVDQGKGSGRNILTRFSPP